MAAKRTRKPYRRRGARKMPETADCPRCVAHEAAVEVARAYAARPRVTLAVKLFCPRCGAEHVDRGYWARRAP
jgi:transcription elongation factor Elf1